MNVPTRFLKSALATALVLLTFAPQLVGAVASCSDGKTVLMSGVCVPTSSATGLSDREPGPVIATVIYWLMGILGILAILLFVVAGIQYLLAGGDEKKTESAKNMMQYAATGVAVGLLAYMIVYTVQQLVSGGSGSGSGGSAAY
ncbi:MAG: pilin [Candidatus Moraniibacteriota bacterium]